MISGFFKKAAHKGQAFMAGIAAALAVGAVAPAQAGLLTEYDLDNDGNVDSLRLGNKLYFSGGELPKYSEAAAINNILGVSGFSVATQGELPNFLNVLVAEYSDLYSSPLQISPDSNSFWALGGSYYNYDTGTFTVSNNPDDVANAVLVKTLQESTVPEPGSLALVGLALAGAGAAAMRRSERKNAPVMAA